MNYSYQLSVIFCMSKHHNHILCVAGIFIFRFKVWDFMLYSCMSNFENIKTVIFDKLHDTTVNCFELIMFQVSFVFVEIQFL